MLSVHRIVMLTAATAALALLTACGSPGGGGGQTPAPTISDFSPAVVARGETLTVTGANFGDTRGSLTIGGVPATVTAWTNTSVQATLPADAPDAWQPVAVTAASGAATKDGLFVGAGYTGDAAGLQGFLDQQSAGTAVLLEAATYDLESVGPSLFVRSLQLYGRGAGQTTLQLDTAVLWLLADFGSAVTLADMQVTQGAVYLGAEAPVAGAALVTLSGASRPQQVQAMTLDQAVQLGNAARAAIHLRGAHLSRTRLGTSPTQYSTTFDLEVHDTQMTDTLVSLSSHGDFLFSGVDIAGPDYYVDLYTLVGSLVMENSQIVMEDGLWSTNGGLVVSDSTIEISDGGLSVEGDAQAKRFGTAEAGGPIRIVGSTLSLKDGDLADSSHEGNLRLETTDAPIVLEDNPAIVLHGDLYLQTFDSGLGAANITVAGNQDVRVGVFPEDEPVHHRRGEFHVFTSTIGLPINVQISNNEVAVNGDMLLEAYGQRHLAMADNQLVLTQASTMGGLNVQGTAQGPVTLTGNDIRSFSGLNISGADLAGGELKLVENEIRSTDSDASTFLVSAVNGDCTVSGNTVELGHDAATATTFLFTCGSGGHEFTMTDNTIAVISDIMSSLLVDGRGASEVLVTSNELSSGVAMTFYSDAAQTTVSENEKMHTGSGTLEFRSVNYRAGSHLRLLNNVITQQNPISYGIIVSGMNTVTMEGNTATVLGTAAPNFAALVFQAADGAANVTATDNTFTNYGRALLFTDDAITEHGLHAAVTGNVFDFPIDAAPKAAELTSIGTPIDATDNQWGSNTDAATVESFVLLTGQTGARGGGIQLDPIRQPPAP